MRSGVDHPAVAAGACVELLAVHEPHTEHRWWTALARGARLSIG